MLLLQINHKTDSTTTLAHTVPLFKFTQKISYFMKSQVRSSQTNFFFTPLYNLKIFRTSLVHSLSSTQTKLLVKYCSKKLEYCQNSCFCSDAHTQVHSLFVKNTAYPCTSKTKNPLSKDEKPVPQCSIEKVVTCNVAQKSPLPLPPSHMK